MRGVCPILATQPPPLAPAPTAAGSPFGSSDSPTRIREDPINLQFAKLSSFGPFPASYQFGAGVFAAQPSTGPTWKIRGAIVILLPRRK
jgi:hypothetical protein